MVREIFKQELESMPMNSTVGLGVFVIGKDATTANSTPNLVEKTADDELPISEEMMALNMKYGRPDKTRIIEEMVDEKVSGSLAVLVCGPAEMADEARNAVNMCLNKRARRIEFVEEVFGW
jgi:hypothetical protein